MNCANPKCGHPTSVHAVVAWSAKHPCLACPCMDFTEKEAPSREPLLAQLDAVIRTRR